MKMEEAGVTEDSVMSRQPNIFMLRLKAGSTTVMLGGTFG
jgi:hypothetical protein